MSGTTTADDGKYKPGTLGDGLADQAGQAMQSAIDKADAVGDGITPQKEPDSKEPKEPTGPVDPKEPRAPEPKEPKEPNEPNEPKS